MRYQTKVMDITEIMKNRKWTWAGHISIRTNNIWIVALTVWSLMANEIEGGTEKGGERNYNSTEAM